MEPTADIAPGEVLLDTYRIDRVVGGGGMGVVVAAALLALAIAGYAHLAGAGRAILP